MASVWVWVRPGGTLGFALASVLGVVGSAGLTGVLATGLCAVVAFGLAGLAGLALCGCFTTGAWRTTMCTGGAGVTALVGAGAWLGTDATALDV